MFNHLTFSHLRTRNIHIFASIISSSYKKMYGFKNNKNVLFLIILSEIEKELIEKSWLVIKRPRDSTTSTTSGQTDTTDGQMSTTSEQTSATSGKASTTSKKTNTTSGKASTTSEKTSTKSTVSNQTNTTNHQSSFASTKSGVVSSAKRVTPQ